MAYPDTKVVGGRDYSETPFPTTLPGFNPSGDERVNVIKTKIEDLITFLRSLREGNMNPDPLTLTEPDARCISIALTKLEEASMWAVKSLFVGKAK